MAAPLYILDTNILVHFVRGSATWKKIRTQYQLLIHEPKPVFSIVSAGELRSLSRHYGWGSNKLMQMEFALGFFDEIYIDSASIVEAYAEIDSHFQGLGRSFGKNDLWIAATAYVSGARLLTTDRDFDAMDPLFIHREWIDPT